MMDDMNRPFPKTVVRRIVRNRSSRNGAGVKLIVLHSTEGGNIPKSARDLEGLGSWFDNPQAQASSHIGVDQDGTSARYANDEDKAWTQAFYNPARSCAQGSRSTSASATSGAVTTTSPGPRSR
jgi:N-acetyl-anhydromuramyl-L-alanine amidase AmpD